MQVRCQGLKGNSIFDVAGRKGLMALPWSLAVLTGVLLTLGHPPFEQAWLGWLALVPLASWFCWVSEKPGRAFALGYVTGVVHFLTGFYWLTEVTVGGWLGSGFFLGLYPAGWAVIWSRIAGGAPETFTSAGNLQRATLGAAAWVMLEAWRGWIFTGFPWNDLGVTQVPMVPLIQIADLGGVALVSGLVAFVSLVLAVTLRRLELEVNRRLRPRIHLDFSIAMFLVGAAFIYGVYALLTPSAPGKTLRYLLVQPSIPVSRYEAPTPGRVALTKTRQLMEDAMAGLTDEEKPEVVIWPETPIWEEFFGDKFFYDLVHGVVEGQPFALIFGSNDRVDKQTYNAAFLVRQHQERVGIYYKNHLVPFGEFVPLTDQFPVLNKYSPLGYNFSAGDLPGIFDIDPPGVRAAMLICFEDTVSRLTRKSLLFRPELFINITNDGWFGRTAQSRQHLHNALMRCVEYRRPMLRATNNGTTAVISEKGVVLEQLGVPEDGSLFEPGVLAGELAVPPVQVTVFERWGNWVPWLSALWLVVGFRRELIRRGRRWWTRGQIEGVQKV